MRAVEMQPAVIQSLNVQNQHQQQVAQPQMNQEAFAAALARTASLRPEQVQSLEAAPERQKAEMLTEERGENPSRRRKGGGQAPGSGSAGEIESPEPDIQPAEPGTRINIVV